PLGGGFYDFVAGFIHHDSRTTPGNTNITIAWNWFENIEQPISSFGPFSLFSSASPDIFSSSL
ncbi:MAG: hypothetical protein MUF85_01415, partial [Patescibacteria group bacterium]|nr:hypothetical protein [Patescibacteria group bacterium]